jgi:hypothetical protein
MPPRSRADKPRCADSQNGKEVVFMIIFRDVVNSVPCIERPHHCQQFLDARILVSPPEMVRSDVSSDTCTHFTEILDLLTKRRSDIQRCERDLSVSIRSDGLGSEDSSSWIAISVTISLHTRPTDFQQGRRIHISKKFNRFVAPWPAWTSADALTNLPVEAVAPKRDFGAVELAIASGAPPQSGESPVADGARKRQIQDTRVGSGCNEVCTPMDLIIHLLECCMEWPVYPILCRVRNVVAGASSPRLGRLHVNRRANKVKAHWRLVSENERQLLGRLHFPLALRAQALGHHYSIPRTRDGGASES